ncbi:membrane-bound PQQ-dependent dehydrogenase, glucose/quinate/shikimate family [Variovorax sp. J2P1-59]|uniref:membrane-bound PQQ-dependent dehydrogenase, glucose/quinate/shikimate family n=1 Tax=Variovorax flavidus TaxID=3053501 RepID=UPI002578AFE4|nr:membrane-bound PQQ-dependent dehydrogenase, glucose/quinate/shikimate family [Variovorax sp. J2P1-59]MDM0073393.1 membrane-bound PQQ-dependent dehydrogenase, glucose/quinate/shikimate family [Variovorax sp. J2P1-59]
MIDPSTYRTGGLRWLLVLFGIVLLLCGAALALGGVRLASVGGSWYYLLGGAALLVAGVQYARRRPSALAWLGLAFIGTVVWALAEVGFDYWQLIPRLVMLAVLTMFGLLLAPRLGAIGPKAAYGMAGVLFVALLATLALGFVPHGVTRPSAPAMAAVAAPAPKGSVGAATDWQYYGRTPNGTRFAPIDQINTSNVKQLEVAWTFRTGRDTKGMTEDQNTPLQIGNTIYSCTPHNVLFALNADTGEQRWKFDPEAKSPLWQRCRGVSFFDVAAAAPATTATANTSAPAPAGNSCAQRVVMTTIDSRLMEVDAHSGTPCAAFGNNGTVDLKAGMGKVDPGFYFQTSAPTVVRNLVIVGGWVWDNVALGEPSGVVRAFNANTGALVWAWDLGNPAITAEPPAGETYTRGTPNVWSTPAFDDKLGLIYLPTGNATPDFWGGSRSKAAEAYSAAVVALDIQTGRERWKFQTTHHDVWDYDVPSQPALYDVLDKKGGTVPALVQTTKRGQIFMLDRRDGTPIAEVQEKPVPQGAAEGDHLSPTQPYSVGMPGVGTNTLTESDMWGVSPFDQLLCRIQFKQLRYEGDFTPPNTTKSLQYPGFYGGMNWGSSSIDERNGTLIVNDMRVAQVVQLIPRDETERRLAAKKAGADGHAGLASQTGTPFGADKNMFMSVLGVPCQKPPFGAMTAIDLNTRQVVWQVPLGTVHDAGPLGIPTRMSMPVGMPTLGGPVTTQGGLVFYAGTQDYFLRALDASNGDELWKARLPVGAQATPMTYVSPDTGRQYVVVSVGGARGSPDRGDYIIAYALPKAN